MAYIVKKDLLARNEIVLVFLMNIEYLILREGMVGDTGFEPVTSTVCKKHTKWGKGKL